MSQAVADKPSFAPSAVQERAAPGVGGWSLLGAAAVAVAFVALFHRWFVTQHRLSLASPDDWGHAWIVPLISGYAVWKQREALRARPLEVYWPGALVLTLGVACYFYFATGLPNHMLQGWSVVLSLYGLALLLLGPARTRLLTFPIAYLLFGVTISEMVMYDITFALQLIASQGAWAMLNIVGVPTDVAGNVLSISGVDGEPIPLEVAKACSGMRTVVAFYALGTAVAFLSCPRWWQRTALLLLVGPIAVGVNILRVASLGLASRVDPSLAQGEAHMFIGVLWLLPALGVFMACVWALKRMVRPTAETGAQRA